MNFLIKFKLYIKLFFSFIKYAVLIEMEYKINFISGILVEIGYFFVKIAYVYIVFKANANSDVITPPMISMHVGTFTIITAFFMFFWPSFSSLSNNIRDGNLDMLIVKPIDLQFIITLRNLSFSMILPNLIGGFILFFYGWSKTGSYMSIFLFLGYLVFIFLGTILIYSIFLIPKAFLSFWFVNSNSADLFISSIWDANNMPMTIYTKVIKFVGIYIFPVFLIANYPHLFVLGKLTIWQILWELVITITMFIIARVVFIRGIKHYNSASS